MADLAPVYLDDSRVKLQGDPKPRVDAIVKAGGKRGVRVVRLRSPTDEDGESVALEQVIDRASEAGPIYLRVVEGGAEGGFAQDESSGLQFGAARPGMAGGGAKGSPGGVALDKQAKSDFTGRDPGNRNGASNQTYGAGDLAPGGRTSLTEEADRAEGHLDGTQGFQSGGRQGEGGAPPYSDADVGSTGPVGHDEGVGARGRRQAGPRPATGDPAQGAQGAAPLRDQSTDRSGRQQGQPWSGDPADARTEGYDDGRSSVLQRGPRPPRSKDGSDPSSSAGAD